MKIKFAFFLLFTSASAFCQTGLENFLKKVEDGNPNLITAAKLTEAQNIDAKTGLWPENPEIEYGYLPAAGSPLKKESYGISQSFDFPLTYITKNKISEVHILRNSYEFKDLRKSILLEASLKYYEFIFLHKKLTEYEERLTNNRRLYESFQKRFDKGDLSVLDLNKSKLQYMSIQNELRLIRQEIESIIKELKLITGDQYFEPSVISYDTYILQPRDTVISRTLANDPGLQALREEINASQLSVKLSKQIRLPDFKVGFEAENEPEYTFRGVRAGMTIPLWANKNRVDLAKAENTWTEARYEEMLKRLVNEKEKLYNKSLDLQKILNEYRNILETTSNVEYLDKALELGQISVIDYFTELQLFYSVIDQYLQTEKEYYRTMSELYDYRL